MLLGLRTVVHTVVQAAAVQAAVQAAGQCPSLTIAVSVSRLFVGSKKSSHRLLRIFYNSR